MEKHPCFPFTYLESEDVDVEERIVFHDVTFTESFGAFKIGEQCNTIQIAYDMGVIETFDLNGNVEKRTGFRAVPSDIIPQQNDEGGSD